MTDDDLMRQFQAVVGGRELDGLRALTSPPVATRTRKPSLQQPMTYRVHVELNNSAPPIWRTLVVNSSIRLDILHSVLQNAFGWTDSHLYRFSLGDDLFGGEAEAYLCPGDVDEGVAGIPTDAVTLEQILREPGDELFYVYDYGDHWDVTLRLEEVTPQQPGRRVAHCVDGERAGPPENCGGRRTAADLGEVLDDPDHFDLEQVDRGLLDPVVLLRDDGVNEDFLELLGKLRHSPVGGPLSEYVLAMMHSRGGFSPEEFDAAMRPVLWFLQRAKGEGIALTSAGYLRPHDVEAAAAVVPGAKGWIGKKNRETQTVPVLLFREMLQALGLLRKRNGRLLLTKAGERGLVDSGFLWGHIASRLIPAKDRFQHEASQVILLCALSPGGTLDESLAADAVEALGWRTGDRPLFFREIWQSTQVLDLLMNLTGEDFDKRHRLRMNSVARMLAWEALAWPQ